MLKSKLKVVKMIGTRTFEVELLQDFDGYYIRYEYRRENQVHYSERFDDFALASYLFDIKVAEMGGH